MAMHQGLNAALTDQYPSMAAVYSAELGIKILSATVAVEDRAEHCSLTSRQLVGHI